MSVLLNPYLQFRGNARQAIEFYKDVFGGKLQLMTYKEGGMSSGPELDNHVMHSHLEADNGINLMASDVPADMPMENGNSIALSLSGTDEATLRGYWDKLSASGTVNMPLEKAPWGDHFGMCTDKFGVNWLVNISAS